MRSSQAYIPVCMSICLYIYLSGHLRCFWRSMHAVCNYVQHMCPQAMGSNHLFVSIIFSSVRPSVCPSGCPRPFTILMFVLISSVGFHRHDTFIPTLGSKGPQWDLVELTCLSIHISVSLYVRISVSVSGCPCQLLVIIRAARNCAQGMWPQAMGLNPLSVSKICPSAHSSIFPYGRPWDFCDFLFVFISSVGVQNCDAFIIYIVRMSKFNYFMVRFRRFVCD